MLRGFREYSGFGELLCLVVAWAVGLAALWSEATGRIENPSGGKVAAGSQRLSAGVYVD